MGDMFSFPVPHVPLSSSPTCWIMPIASIFSSLRNHARGRRNASHQANTEKLGGRLAEVVARTWDLGFTAFGGPPVHFQILHRRFVEGVGFGGGSKWIDEQTVSASNCHNNNPS
jgi:hypothetical protein